MSMWILNLFDDHRSDTPYCDAEELAMLQAINHAHAEWVNAQHYFNNVSEPELVDYAIYNMEAAKKKYIYMLKQAKLKGLVGIQSLLYFKE